MARSRGSWSASVALAISWGLAPARARIGLGITALTASSFDTFIRSNDKALVDFYNPGDAQWIENNLELQTAVREARNFGCQVPIAKVNAGAEAELARRFTPNARYPQLMWFLHGEPTQYHRTLRKAKMIVDFVLALDRNPIQNFSSEEEVRQSVNRAVFAEIPWGSPMYRVLEVVASKHMDTIEFAFKDSPKDDIRWIEEDHEVVRYGGGATVDAMERWVRGQITKSEPIPEAQEGGSVLVVGKTFEEIVFRADKDVFLLIYAPWCGFCRKFFPVWESFARSLAKAPHLVVAKMDGDRNGSPNPEDFKWVAYPTVFFLRAGERKPVVFHGNRTAATLLDFVRKHASKPVLVDLDGSKEADLAESDWEL